MTLKLLSSCCHLNQLKVLSYFKPRQASLYIVAFKLFWFWVRYVALKYCWWINKKINLNIVGCWFGWQAKLLTRVHHRNLVSLFGYCDEGSSMVLIYEYMNKGNLKKNLAGIQLYFSLPFTVMLHPSNYV